MEGQHAVDSRPAPVGMDKSFGTLGYTAYLLQLGYP